MIVEAKNLSFAYNVDDIFSKVNFIINEGDKIGLVGDNGSGKSTLVKCIIGELEPKGRLVFSSGKKISYLKQQITSDSRKTVMESGLDKYLHIIDMEARLRQLEHEIADSVDDPSGLEKLYEEYGNLQEEFHDLNGYGYKSEIKGYLSMVGLDESFYDKEVRLLSGGEKARLELALVFMEKPDLLILDEPTNHMDTLMIEYLERYMKEFKGSIIFISHDRLLLRNVASRIFDMHDGDLSVYNMGYDEFRRVKKLEEEEQARHFDNFKKEYERQKEIIRRFRSYATERYYRLADSREKMLKRMKEEEKPKKEEFIRFNFKEPQRTGYDVLTALNISKSFPDKELFSDISFEVKAGDRLAFMGPNGSGKTTLFRILMGLEDGGGEFLFGSGVKLGYFNQELKVLDEENTLIDEISDEFPRMNITDIRTMLGSFLFRGDEVFKEMKELSGGERARVSLMKLILTGSNVLFLDEPTNHLDLKSKEVLEDALEAFKGTLVFISHDRFFVKKLANKILDLTPGRQVFFEGDYDFYISRLEGNDKEVKEEINLTERKKDRQKEREKIRQSQQRKKKIDDLMDIITKIESEIDEIDEQLAAQDTYDRPERAIQLGIDRDEREKQLALLLDEWENLSSLD